MAVPLSASFLFFLLFFLTTVCCCGGFTVGVKLVETVTGKMPADYAPSVALSILQALATELGISKRRKERVRSYTS
jgi:hypothetical protein